MAGAVGALVLQATLLAQGGIVTDGPLTVFRTGSGAPLLTLELDLGIPDLEREPRLEFTFGFATDEPELSGTFFDSFSVTLERADRQATALLLTSDRTGVLWAPLNPGGLVLPEEDLSVADVQFADLSPAFEFKWAYSVSYTLPPEFTGGSTRLFLDLFDNHNALASMAYVRDVRVTALPSTNFPSGLKLFAAPRATGPYTEPPGVQWDPANRTVIVPLDGSGRFFRLRSVLRARILALRSEGQDWVFPFVFDPVILALESAQDPGGPYAPEPAAVFDLRSQTVRVPRSPSPRFYRIQSDARAVLESIRQEADGWLLHYAFPEQSVELLSADAVMGPYLPESAAQADPQTRQLRVPQGGAMRFFRLSADRPLRITRLQLGDRKVILNYE